MSRPFRSNSYTDGPYSSATRKWPLRGSITNPSGSKLRPSWLLSSFSRSGFRPFSARGRATGAAGGGSSPNGSVNLIVSLTRKSEMCPVQLVDVQIDPLNARLVVQHAASRAPVRQRPPLLALRVVVEVGEEAQPPFVGAGLARGIHLVPADANAVDEFRRGQGLSGGEEKGENGEREEATHGQDLLHHRSGEGRGLARVRADSSQAKWRPCDGGSTTPWRLVGPRLLLLA